MNPSFLERVFCGPAFFITRADDFLRVRKIYYACGYLYDLMICKKIVLMFLKFKYSVQTLAITLLNLHIYNRKIGKLHVITYN